MSELICEKKNRWYVVLGLLICLLSLNGVGEAQALKRLNLKKVSLFKKLKEQTSVTKTIQASGKSSSFPLVLNRSFSSQENLKQFVKFSKYVCAAGVLCVVMYKKYRLIIKDGTTSVTLEPPTEVKGEPEIKRDVSGIGSQGSDKSKDQYGSIDWFKEPVGRKSEHLQSESFKNSLNAVYHNNEEIGTFYQRLARGEYAKDTQAHEVQLAKLDTPFFWDKVVIKLWPFLNEEGRVQLLKVEPFQSKEYREFNQKLVNGDYGEEAKKAALRSTVPFALPFEAEGYHEENSAESLTKRREVFRQTIWSELESKGRSDYLQLILKNDKEIILVGFFKEVLNKKYGEKAFNALVDSSVPAVPINLRSESLWQNLSFGGKNYASFFKDAIGANESINDSKQNAMVKEILNFPVSFKLLVEPAKIWSSLGFHGREVLIKSFLDFVDSEAFAKTYLSPIEEKAKPYLYAIEDEKKKQYVATLNQAITKDSSTALTKGVQFVKDLLDDKYGVKGKVLIVGSDWEKVGSNFLSTKLWTKLSKEGQQQIVHILLNSGTLGKVVFSELLWRLSKNGFPEGFPRNGLKFLGSRKFPTFFPLSGKSRATIEHKVLNFYLQVPKEAFPSLTSTSVIQEIDQYVRIVRKLEKFRNTTLQHIAIRSNVSVSKDASTVDATIEYSPYKDPAKAKRFVSRFSSNPDGVHRYFDYKYKDDDNILLIVNKAIWPYMQKEFHNQWPKKLERFMPKQ